jgi:hypothetical protein
LDVDSVSAEGAAVENPEQSEVKPGEGRRKYHLIIDAEQADHEDGKDNEI